MNEETRIITAKDQHKLECFFVASAQKAKGGIVILQEIFGVTEQLKEVARQYAQDGYDVAIPALYDRHQTGTVFAFEKGPDAMALMEVTELSSTLLDIEGAIACLKDNVQQVAVMGFCWGGGLALHTAQVLDVEAGIVFYGTRLTRYLDHPLTVPVIGHFGNDDPHVPQEDLENAKNTLPKLDAHVYDAGHAFANHARDAYRKEAANLAHQRNQTFLKSVLNN